MSSLDEGPLTPTVIHGPCSSLSTRGGNRRFSSERAIASSVSGALIGGKYLMRSVADQTGSGPRCTRKKQRGSREGGYDGEDLPECCWSTCLGTHQQEHMLHCCSCHRSCHAYCCDPPLDIRLVRRYANGEQWRCRECNMCVLCHVAESNKSTLICRDCDRGFHVGCCRTAGPVRVPKSPEGWVCRDCRLCARCACPLSEGSRVTDSGRVCPHCYSDYPWNVVSDVGAWASERKPGIIRIRRNCDRL